MRTCEKLSKLLHVTALYLGTKAKLTASHELQAGGALCLLLRHNATMSWMRGQVHDHPHGTVLLAFLSVTCNHMFSSISKIFWCMQSRLDYIFPTFYYKCLMLLMVNPGVEQGLDLLLREMM
jgi:hypothetical protein